MIIFGLWRRPKSIGLHYGYGEHDFDIFIFIDLDLWPLNVKYDPLVTLARRNVFTKLQAFTSFLFLENRRHGTDEWGATLNAAL